MPLNINRVYKKRSVALALLVVFFVVATLFIFRSSAYFNKGQDPPQIDSFAVENARENGNFEGPDDSVAKDKLVIYSSPTQDVSYTSGEITIAEPANAVVLKWNQTATSDISKLEVRTRAGESWTDWADVEYDGPEHSNSSEGNEHSALILADRIDGLQYRFTLLKNADPPSFISIESTSIEGIDSREGPSEKISFVDKILSGLSQSVHAQSSGPNVISRAEWGSPEPDSSPSWAPEYAKVGRVIIHHTATTETSNSYADVRAIWQYHARSLGWGDIGYHYLVDSSGRIFSGRYRDQEYATNNNVEVIGGHAYGNNVGTVGISAIGDYRYKSLSSATYNSIASLIGYKLAPYGIDPRGNGPYGHSVIGHYQVSSTACPGTNIINRLADLRNSAWDPYEYYLQFQFRSLDSPRWMQLANDAYKLNLTTDENIGPLLEAGRQIYFPDKFYKNNEWYLRSRWDKTNNNRDGLALSDLEEIPINPTVPTWLSTKSDTRKIDPVREKNFEAIPKSTGFQVLDSITVNDVLYYRTAWENSLGQLRFIPASALEAFRFYSFNQPRYLVTNKAAKKVNVQTGDTISTIPQGTYLYFDRRITIDGMLHAQIESDHGTNYAISMNDLSELAPIRFTSLDIPRTMKLKINTHKRQLPTGSNILPELLAGRQIFFPDKVQINGVWYLRTQWDKDNGNQAGIPLSELSEL